MARRGDRDAAIPVIREAATGCTGGCRGYALWASAPWWRRCWNVAARATGPKPRGVRLRLANLPADDGSAIRDITLLRLRALLARANGDDVAYRDLAERYRAMAESLGFEGHIDWATAMIEAVK